MVTPARSLVVVALLAAITMFGACFPGERPTAAHLSCTDGACICEAGYADCDGDPSTGCELPVSADRDNCGGCNVRCHNSCSDGACATADCDAGFADCTDAPGCESDLQNDEAHCGRCDHGCLGGGCGEGHCQPFELLPRGFYAMNLAVDAEHVYFCEGISGTILRTSVQGGAVETLATDQPCALLDFDSRPGLLAVGGGYVYWTTGRWLDSDYRERLHVMSLSDASSRVVDELVQADGPCCAVQAGPGCSEDAGIEACVCAQDALCCSTAWDSWCADEVASFGCGSCSVDRSFRALRAGDQHLMVSMALSDGSGQVLALPAGGGMPEQIAAPSAPVDHLGLMAQQVYWSEPSGGGSGGLIDTVIMRAPVSGPDIGVSEVVAFGKGVDNLASYGDHIFWTAQQDKRYALLSKTEGGSIDPIYLSARPFTALMPDDTDVYWTEAVNTIPVGMYRVSISDGLLTTFSTSHYVYSAADGPTLVAWADYSDRIFGVAK